MGSAFSWATAAATREVTKEYSENILCKISIRKHLSHRFQIESKEQALRSPFGGMPFLLDVLGLKSLSISSVG